MTDFDEKNDYDIKDIKEKTTQDIEKLLPKEISVQSDKRSIWRTLKIISGSTLLLMYLKLTIWKEMRAIWVISPFSIFFVNMVGDAWKEAKEKKIDGSPKLQRITESDDLKSKLLWFFIKWNRFGTSILVFLAFSVILLAPETSILWLNAAQQFKVVLEQTEALLAKDVINWKKDLPPLIFSMGIMALFVFIFVYFNTTK